MAEELGKPNLLLGPQALTTFSDWLFSGFFQKPGYEQATGADGLKIGWDLAPTEAYPHQLTPDISQTRLPDVWNAWQPFDGGSMYLANYLQSGNKTGQTDPKLKDAMQWGGTGGPGNVGLANLKEFGVASPGSGNYLANQAQFGVTSPNMTGLHKYMSGSQPTKYQPPTVTKQPVQRRT